MRAWSIYSHDSETGPEERLVCIGYFKTKLFEHEFKDIFPMVYATPARHLTKWNIKVPTLNQNGVFNISSRYKLPLHDDFDLAFAFYTSDNIMKNEQQIIQDTNSYRKSYRKFMLPCFSVTCFKHVMQLWLMSAFDRTRDIMGYDKNGKTSNSGLYFWSQLTDDVCVSFKIIIFLRLLNLV